MAKKQMHLGYAMYNTGTHPVGWTESAADIATDIRYFTHVARLAEAAKFDMVFRADVPFARLSNIEAWSRNPFHMNILEPLMLFSALSQVTTHIGLAATLSTSYTEPYNVARQLAALDHVSGGRAACNLVTSFSSQASRNFGIDEIPSHAERYARAREYVRVLKLLWDTYEDDAIVLDRAAGRYFDPQKFHPVDFDGEYIRVHGALNVARPPQGYPVLIQAGASPDGRAFAAEIAEVIFSGSSSLPEAKAFYADMKERVAACGRDPSQLKILPAVTVILGDSGAAAQAAFEALDSRAPHEVKLQYLADDLGVKLAGLPLDQPVPIKLLPQQTKLITAHFERVAAMVRERMPLRDMLRQYRRAVGDVVCGTASEVADRMDTWVAEAACDGFNLIVPVAPSGFEQFCAEVVPELQRRGSFRTEYTGSTLREHFGLVRPANSHMGR